MYVTVTRDNACNPLTSPSNHTPTHPHGHPPQTHTLCKILATPFDPVIKGCVKHISGNYVDRREILLKDKQVFVLYEYIIKQCSSNCKYSNISVMKKDKRK